MRFVVKKLYRALLFHQTLNSGNQIQFEWNNKKTPWQGVSSAGNKSQELVSIKSPAVPCATEF